MLSVLFCLLCFNYLSNAQGLNCTVPCDPIHGQCDGDICSCADLYTGQDCATNFTEIFGYFRGAFIAYTYYFWSVVTIDAECFLALFTCLS